MNARVLNVVILWMCSAACVTTSIAHGYKKKAVMQEPVILVDVARGHIRRARTRAQEVLAKQAKAQSVEAARQHMAQIMSQTYKSTGTVWHFMPEQPSYRKVLKDFAKREGSLSIGSASTGWLLGGMELPIVGKHHVIIPRAHKRRTRFGTKRLVDMLKRVAKQVALAHPGSKLAVGNLSTKSGGDIRWSVSHNSGRDVDLAFYVTSAKNSQELSIAPDLISFDDEGVARGHKNLIFDVARNWTLVQAILEQKSIQVQYLFISTGLKKKLLTYAKAQGVSATLLNKARHVLHQPTDSSPHDDHLHVRLTCGLRERLLGCLDRGPRWSWVDWYDQELLGRAAITMAAAMRDPDKRIRRAALEYLKEVRLPHGADVALWFGLHEQEESMRQLALDVASANYVWSTFALESSMRWLTEEQTSFASKKKIYAIMRRSVSKDVISFLQTRVVDPSVPSRERVHAVYALTHHMRHELVPFLIDRLEVESSHKVRAMLARVLRRITVRQEQIDWHVARSSWAGKKAVDGWRLWWKAHGACPRRVWVQEGLARAAKLDQKHVFEVSSIRALLGVLPKAPDHIRYNINKTLRTLTGRWHSLEKTDPKALHSFWSKWFEHNESRLLSAR